MAAFRSLVVPIDPDRTVDGARALPTAVALARRAMLPIEVVAVASLTHVPIEVEQALAERLETPGDVDVRVHALLDAEPSRAIVGFLADHPDGLLVMATHARGLVAERLLGSVSEAVLARSERPALLVGPGVDRQSAGRLDTLIVGVGDAPRREIASGVAAWQRTFGGRNPWLLDVVHDGAMLVAARSAGDIVDSGHVQSVAHDLGELGIEAQWDVLPARSPADALVHYTETLDGPVIAVASERWTDPHHRHFGSVARSVAHRASCPVLVIPLAAGSIAA